MDCLISTTIPYDKKDWKDFMAEPVEFGSFYQLLQSVKEGREDESRELEWMLAEYEHAKESKSAYDELGQIFCHHGIMELYEYTGLDNIQTISKLNSSVWDYLKLRIGCSLADYMVKSMISHSKQHELSKKVGQKWEVSNEDIEENIEGLAKYVVDGIIDIVYA